MRRIRLVLGVAALVTGAVLTMSSPAMAAEVVVGSNSAADDSIGADQSTALAEGSTDGIADTALAADCYGPPPGTVGGCFRPNSDTIYVMDNLLDGHVAYVYWENYLKTSSGKWKLYRYGKCHSGGLVGAWYHCSYNFYEDTTLNPYGNKGSGVRVYLCATGIGCNQNYAWVRNHNT